MGAALWPPVVSDRPRFADPGSIKAHSRLGGRMKTTRGRIALLVALLLLALGGMTYSLVRGNDSTSGGATHTWSPTPRSSVSQRPAAASSTARATSTSPAPSTPKTRAPAECGPQTPIIPTQLGIESMKVTSKVLSLGTDPTTRAAAAPPKNQSRTTGWFNEGPLPGSSKGKVLLTIHTYRNGGALGNALNSSTGLEPGDIIRLSDASGNTVCYRYRESLKVWVKDYANLPSNAIYDNTGDPEVAIIICWDFNKSTQVWDSRIVFYADPIQA